MRLYQSQPADMDVSYKTKRHRYLSVVVGSPFHVLPFLHPAIVDSLGHTMKLICQWLCTILELPLSDICCV